LDNEQLVDRARGISPWLFALPVGIVLTLADLLPGLAPTSALLALVATLIWFPIALASFAIVTWLRKDQWLTAGFIVGLTPVVARLIADLITRDDLFAATGPSTELIVRAVIAVPLCGGAVYGARWLTGVVVSADASF
jgi:hypothetical protein